MNETKQINIYIFFNARSEFMPQNIVMYSPKKDIQVCVCVCVCVFLLQLNKKKK